jgi:thioredoxin
MNRLRIVILSIISLFSFTSKSQNYHNLNSEDFRNIIAKNKGTLLDVRTVSEFENGHIEKSGQLNYYALDFRKMLLLLPKNEPIYLYCNTGWRSKKAAEILSENGYNQVYNLEKGIMEWELNDFPVKVSPNAKADTKDKMEFDEFNALIKSEGIVFFDFYAPWCGPCRKMMPDIDELQKEYKQSVSVVKINADASKKLVKELRVNSVPFLLMFKDGKKVYEHYGLLQKKDLVKVFNKYID